MEKPQVVRLGSVTSTQDIARDLPIGSVVVADHQTAGRGRLSHRWETKAGSALLVSFVLEPNPLLSLAAGVAAAEACGPGVRLKWPHDLLLDGRTVGGILGAVSGSEASDSEGRARRPKRVRARADGSGFRLQRHQGGRRFARARRARYRLRRVTSR